MNYFKQSVIASNAVFFVLVMVAAPSYATHHRDHALGFLEQIAPHIVTIQAFAPSVASMVVPGTHPWQLTWDGSEAGGMLLDNVAAIGGRVESVIDTLNGDISPMCYQLGLPAPIDELDCARRLINQPNHSQGVRSALQFATSAMYGVIVVTSWGEGCEPSGQWCSNESLSIILGQLDQIWKNLDQALWHINDAIEENGR